MAVICAIEDAALVATPPSVDPIEFRQLRHHTRNALQRILIQILEAPGLCGSREGRRVADNIVHHIELSAAISDALFGFTQSVGSLSERMRSLCESLIALYSDPTQTIQLEVAIAKEIAICRRREDIVLRIVHELVANAAKHGMYMRLLGRIVIRLGHEAEGCLLLSVANDGWQMSQQAPLGEGIRIVKELAQSEAGEVLIKAGQQTTVEVRLPADEC